MRGLSCIPWAARPAVSPEITKNPGPWQGEERDMWRPTEQEQTGFHGANLHQPRHNSRYLSLQLKAGYDGTETPDYQLQEVHHRA